MSDVVNRGASPNDPAADDLYTAYGKINTEFDGVDTALGTKVDKITGKGLSTDDFQADATYPNLRAQATTKDDVGLGNVENLTPAQLRAGVTKEDVGLGNVENLTPTQLRQGVTKEHVGLGSVENLTPHQLRDGTTKEHVGLGNVENLTPAQLRAGVTKQDVGLGNVDNLSAASIRSGTTKSDVGLANVENYGISSEAEAKAGTVSNKYMTPERTSDHFGKRVTYGTAAPDDGDGDNGDLYFQYED